MHPQIRYTCGFWTRQVRVQILTHRCTRTRIRNVRVRVQIRTRTISINPVQFITVYHTNIWKLLLVLIVVLLNYDLSQWRLSNLWIIVLLLAEISCLSIRIMKLSIFIVYLAKSAGTRNPPETRRVRVRVQKCTRGSTCGRVLPSPAGLPAGGFCQTRTRIRGCHP